MTGRNALGWRTYSTPVLTMLIEVLLKYQLIFLIYFRFQV